MSEAVCQSQGNSIGETERGLLRNGWPQGATPHQISSCRNPLALLRRAHLLSFHRCRNMDSAGCKANWQFQSCHLQEEFDNQFRNELCSFPFLISAPHQTHSDCSKCAVWSLFCCGAYILSSFQKASSEAWGCEGGGEMGIY